ncbi:MAG: ERCC4 domain-containing protein, partial [Promethearchaeota archaeon]
DYAYCFIEKKYMQEAKQPQILGLTASPGSTKEKITEIKENLFIEHVEIKTETDRDVKPYVHAIKNEWVKIKLPLEFLEIRNILKENLKNIYKSLKKMDLINTYDVNNVTRKDLLSLDSVINKRISQASTNEDKFELFDAKKKVANAMRLSHMMELIETQGIHALNEYLTKNQKKIQKNKANKSLKELFYTKDVRRIISLTGQAISSGIYHPKLEKLKEILHQQLKENEHSRILVFCHFRDSVNNIVKFLETDDFIRAHRFVGQQTRESDKGLSQKEQVKILEDFKQGIYNVLIATSVAEEGLDIAECDIVVFYDVVPSAIRSIQRRGRTGRKKEGKVLILMAENTRDEGYYWAEKIKEKNMKLSLKEMRASEAQNKTHGKEQKDILSYLKNMENDRAESETPGGEKIPKKKEESPLTKEEKDSNEITIVCDHRETASPVVRALSLQGVRVQLEHLQVSDYILSNRVGVERKSSKDFNDSLIDGRLFKELKELKNNFKIPILILEGDPFTDSTVTENALYGALTSIILNFNVFIYKTASPEETARMLLELAKKEQTKKETSINLRPEKAPFKTSDLMEFIIAGIPGVNASRAKNLLKEFKTLQALFNSDIPDLTKVEGIGKSIAQQIYKLSRFKYQEE